MLLYLVLGISLLGLTCAYDQKKSAQINDEEQFNPNLIFSDTFDWKLFKELAGKRKNVLLSPISLKLILALLYQGSTRSAEREFQSVLQFVDKNSVNDEYRQILSTLQPSQRREYLLNIGTSIFLDSQFPVNPNFEAIANQYYKTEMKLVNFTDAGNSASNINSWIVRTTNGKITKIVSADDLQQTVMLITNAIYFKGTWRHQFPKNQTYFGKFLINGEDFENMEDVTVPYMSTTDTFFMKESTELDSRILRLPYKGSDYSMFIILPNSLGGLPNLIKKINLNNLSTLLYSLEKRLVEVNIPKFKLKVKSKLVQPLRNFGIHQIFENRGSLAGIANGNASSLIVSDIVQKTGIELDEEGSVVYSATDVNIGNKFGEPKEIFHATHPFLFFIGGNNGTILFIGKIENPSDAAQTSTLNTVAAQVFSARPEYEAWNRKEVLVSSLNEETGKPVTENVYPNLEPSGTDFDTTHLEGLLYRFNLFDMELLNAFTDLNTNVLISPASIKATLAMILEGAAGKCAEEISEALRIPNINDRDVRIILRRLLSSLTDGKSIESSNGIFVSAEHRIVSKYQQIIESFYNGNVSTVNFRNVQNAVNVINNWVSKVTHDNIKEIIGSQSISPETSAVIANAIYFKGTWRVLFDTQNTRTKCFHTETGCVSTQMMHVSSSFKYSYINRLRTYVVEIPYQNNYSMLIVLPSEGTNIRNIIRDLPHFNLLEIASSLRESEITLEIPKFTFDYSVDLVEQLKLLKIRQLFGPQANLSGIVEGGNVLINSLIHKTKIEVNEEGTVAAAATGAVVIPLMGATSIVVDRPFIFYIYHQNTGNIIFEGVLVNPQETK